VNDCVPRELLWIVFCLRFRVRGGAVQTAAVALEVVHYLDLTKHTLNKKNFSLLTFDNKQKTQEGISLVLQVCNHKPKYHIIGRIYVRA